MKIYEVTTKPKAALKLDQSRLEALKAQVKRSQDAVNAEKAKQKLKASQTALAAAT